MSGRFALIVASGAYSDPKLSRLRTPTRDAEELARVLRDPAAQGGLRLVDGQVDLEVADRRVAQHAGQLLGVAGRGPQPAQLRVAVGAVRHDQRVAAGHG